MEWTENPQLADRMLSLLAEDMKLDKPLPHMTELIYCLTRSWNDRFDHIPLSPKEVVLFAVGVELGEGLLRPHRTEVQGELEGIHYSLDFLDEDVTSDPDLPVTGTRLGELKSTRMSVNKHPSDWPKTWIQQLLGYMKGHGGAEAIYAVVYVIPAALKAWEVKATQEEIDTNWSWLQARKVIYMDFVNRGERPTPFQYNETWECRDCRYRLGCDEETLRLNREAEARNAI